MSIWIADRKPKKFSDVVGNTQTCKLLQRYVDTNTLPNIVLVGDHGTGKRTLAHLLVKQYLGEHFKKACLEIDGAFYRGKDVISSGRGTVNTNSTTNKSSRMPGPNVLEFATTQMRLPDGKKKVVIIYNFNDMTTETHALRRIMERFSESTRFILICNEMDIIEAIQSRCIPLQLKPLNLEESEQLVLKLLEDDNVSPDLIRSIILLSDGDMKKLVNYSQVVHAGNQESPLTITQFHDLFNTPPIKAIEEILISIYAGDDVYGIIKEQLIDMGHAHGDIMEITFKILLFPTEATSVIPEDLCHEWLRVISKTYCETTPLTDNIHIYSFFSELYLCLE